MKIHRHDKFIWSNECQKALDALKEELLADPLLTYPDLNEPFILTTDASNTGLGATLSQIKDGVVRPIAYTSRTIQKHETNWAITEKEALAIVWAVKHFRTFLLGRKFKIITDHSALKVLMRGECMNSRLQRWACKLQGYEFEVFYKPEKQNLYADLLSRLHEKPDLTNEGLKDAICDPLDSKMIAEDIFDTEDGLDLPHFFEPKPPNQLAIAYVGSTDKIEQAQSSDSLLNLLVQYKRLGEVPSDPLLADSIKKWGCKTVLDNDLVYYYPDKSEPMLWWVPESLVQEILSAYHDCLGHMSGRKVKKQIESKYFWPTLGQDVMKFCKECHSCQINKNTVAKTKPPLHSLSLVGPFERIVMDSVGPITKTDRGNAHILVFCDWYTKWTVVVPVPDITAETIATAFVEKIVCVFGAPRDLLSDKGPALASQLFIAVCHACNVNKVFSVGYSPQTNGIVERFNRTMLNMIRTMTDNRKNWDTFLPSIQLAYNSSFHETTRFSPFYMLFARDPVLPMDVSFKVPIANLQLPTSEYILGLKEKILATWKAADIEILRSQQCAKARQKIHDPQFAEGDLVLLENERKTRAISAKLQAKYLGPYRIVRLDGSLNADLIDLTDPAEPSCRVHTRRLIRYFGLYVAKLSEHPQPPLLSGSSVDHSAVLEIDEPELETVAVISNVNAIFNVSNFRDLFCDGDNFEPHNKFENCVSLPIEVLKSMVGRGFPPPGAGGGNLGALGVGASGNIPFSQVLVRNEYGFDQARNNGERNLVIATNSSITGTGQTAFF